MNLRLTKNNIRFATATSLIALLNGGQVFAQENTVEDEPLVMEEVVVSGIRGSLKDALNVKRGSTSVMEAISSEDIGQLPDVTIAEALVRLPGLNGTRDRGNNSQATIRGLGPRLVLGLVNGREVATSEPDRGIRWEQYPSELISGVQVHKSQSADLVSGGIAGTVNLNTVEPLSYNGPQFILRGGPVYYEAGDDIPDYSPFGLRGSASFVKQLSDKLGVAVGLTYQKQKNGFPSLQGWAYNEDDAGDIDGDGEIDFAPWGAQTEVKKLDQTRYGAMGVVQYQASDSFTLKYDVFYTEFDITENQNQAWYQNWGNWTDEFGSYTDYADYEIVDGSVVAGTVNDTYVRNVIAQYNQTNSVFLTGLNGEWVGENWTVEGDVSYSLAKRENIWNSVYLDNDGAIQTTWDFRAGAEPYITSPVNPADVSNQFVAGSWNDGPQHLRDELVAGKLDFSRNFASSTLSSLDFGARFASRDKEFDAYNWWQDGTVGSIPESLLSNYTMSGIVAPPLLNGDFDEVADAALGGIDESLAAEDVLAGWRVKEKVLEAYVKANFERDLGDIPVTGNIGVRVVRTEVDSFGKETVDDGEALDVNVKNDYSKVLPSLNLNFHLTEDKIIRAGVARAIARPPLDELRAGRLLNTTTEVPTGSGGNPTLEPFEATQFDLAFEWYFHDEALAAVSLYYKDVETHVGYLTEDVDIDGTNYQIYRPANGDGGTIKGVELTFQTPFYFLSEAFQNFGIYSNYAYVDSSIKEFAPENNPLDASGLAKHTATVDLWYSSGGFEARLGYKYHSPFTMIFGWNPQDLITLESEHVLDFSTSYQINENVTVRLQVNNLTNEALRLYRDGHEDRLARYDEYGRRVLVDMTLKF
ncbi:TonB-dependent receptor [Emcibacter sp.]|uniref:TonB-dependent receptor n=1 Tax=Emcibacter sp. TaxID=1979954 RepID=UPI003A8CF159